MTWVPFFAGRDDLLALLHFVYAETDCIVQEGHSRPDCPARRLATRDQLAALPELGVAPDGPHLVLWSPNVGAPPITRRVTFRPGAVPGHTHRFVVEGCSLITLRCGGVQGERLVASRLGWWTEASARAKAAELLGADRVDWPALAKLGRRLRYHIARRLASASAGGRPVLAQAHALAQSGLRLWDESQPLANLTLDAA